MLDKLGIVCMHSFCYGTNLMLVLSKVLVCNAKKRYFASQNIRLSTTSNPSYMPGLFCNPVIDVNGKYSIHLHSEFLFTGSTYGTRFEAAAQHVLHALLLLHSCQNLGLFPKLRIELRLDFVSIHASFLVGLNPETRNCVSQVLRLVASFGESVFSTEPITSRFPCSLVNFCTKLEFDRGSV